MGGPRKDARSLGERRMSKDCGLERVKRRRSSSEQTPVTYGGKHARNRTVKWKETNEDKRGEEKGKRERGKRDRERQRNQGREKRGKNEKRKGETARWTKGAEIKW